MVDRLIYGETPTYPEFLQGLQRDLTGGDPDRDLASALGNVLCDRLDLEAMLLVSPGENGHLDVRAAVGERRQRVIQALADDRLMLPKEGDGDGTSIIRLEGDQVLSTELWASGTKVGTMLLGPKRGGELFVGEEVGLVMNVAPFIAAALERHELSETMRQLNRRLVETEERERARMVMDLHDGPLQKAVALAFDRSYGSIDPKQVAGELVTELRELGSRLRPPILDDLGLPSSLDWLLDQSLRGTGVNGSLVLEGLDEDTRLPADVELALFRVTQEALNNAVKHASCTLLTVTLSCEDDQLTLSVRDNGVGVGGAGSGRIPSSRLGMVGMRERVLQIDGRMEIQSKPGEGTLIQATVPVPPGD